MLFLEDNSTTDFDITIMVDDDWQPCFMRLHLRLQNITVSEGNYPNAAALSADFRCRLGYSDAVAVLRKAGVPETSRLWQLNHGA